MFFRKISIKVLKVWTMVLSAVSLLVVAGCSRKNYIQSADKMQTVDKDSLIEEQQRLKSIIEYRSTSVIYGTPEMMKKRAEENDSIKKRIGELDEAIRLIEESERKNGK